jgi:prevent-host-death family protein
MAMKRVGVAELKDQLSKYLRAAEGGVEVEVTDRERPIARIVAARTPQQLLARPARVPFSALRTRDYPSAGWPRGSTELLLEERQGR